MRLKNSITIKVKAFCLNLYLFISLTCYGQSFSTVGTDFVFGVMQNGGGLQQNNTIYLVIASYKNNVTVSISSPYNNFQQSVIIQQDSAVTIILPSYFINDVSEQIINKGIRIIATDTISVSCVNERNGSADASTVNHVNSNSGEYSVLSYHEYLNGGSLTSEFLIVASDSATAISIIPTDTTATGVLPGDTINILLNKEETYLVQSHNDLTGTIVYGNKPFALFGGSVGTGIPNDNCCTDHLFEQIIPNQYWDTSYISIPLMTRTDGDTYYLMAKDSNTTIYFDGAFHANLNATEFVEDTIVNATYITSDKPIAVVQFSNSSTYDLNSVADPFMIQLRPVEWMVNKSIFKNVAYFPFIDIDNYFLNIMVKNSGVNNVYLDGINLSSSIFTIVGSSGYSWASFMLDTSTSATHSLTSDSGFIAYHYGFGYFNSYGYTLPGYSGDISTGIITLPKPLATVLSPNPFKGSTILHLPYAPVNGEGFTFTLFNVDGKLVKQIDHIHKTNVEIKRGNLSRGIYFYRLTDGKGNFLTSGKIIAE